MPEDEKPSRYRIADLAVSDRPRERLARLGAQSLTTAELLAILLRTGMRGENAVQVGQRLLNTCKGLAGIQRLSFEELCHQHGIGNAKAAEIKAALELGNRLRQEGNGALPIISSPKDAADLVAFEMEALDQDTCAS